MLLTTRSAMSPKYTSRDEVDASFLEHEKEILLAQAKQENPNKPDNIIEKMIIGRLNKEMKEICLLDQVYVQDSDLTVAKYVEKVAKENGANMTVKRFVRFETGEGLEKKNEDFAAEVAIARLVKSKLNSVFKRFLPILTSVMNYCKISQNIVLFWVQIG